MTGWSHAFKRHSERPDRRAVLIAISLLLMPLERLPAQERPAQRVASIVSVAVAEYSLGVDERGRLISDLEYGEAVSFLGDARGVAERLSGDKAELVRSLLDSLSAAVAAKRPPSQLKALHEQFEQALGADAALDMPTRQLDVAEGQSQYQANCASCHGVTGMGDGPQARGMVPPPPALGDAAAMRDMTPALMYHIVSVGIAGTAMAGWSANLTPDQRWNIVAYVNSLRGPALQAPGQGMFLQRCAGCHGPTGASDGVMAAALTRLPAELSAFGWHVDRSDARRKDKHASDRRALMAGAEIEESL